MGVEFSVRIHLTEGQYQIQINDGKDFILFDTKMPSWAIDHVMVTGDVINVNFGTKARRCSGSGEESLPQNIIYIDQEKKLTNGDVILIGGIIENGIDKNNNITVSFYYEALDWHEKFGKTIFRGNFSKDGKTTFGSYPAPKKENKEEFKWIEFKEKENKEIWRRECKNVSKELNENDKFSLVINLRDGYYNVNYNGMDCDFKIYYQHWAIQYIVVISVNVCNKGKGLEKNLDICDLENCFVSVDVIKHNVRESNKFGNKYPYLFGCGDCPPDVIPCRMCKATDYTCNDSEYFKYAHYCWNTSNVIDVCDLNIYTSLCYYVVDMDHTVVHQGCGAYHSVRNPWQTKYVATVSCEEYICDSKKVYEETPFCLKRVKGEEKRWRRKGEDEEVTQCSTQECYIYKHKDGKFEQGCGKCNSNNKIPCRTCYTKMCNNEKFFDEGFFCWKKDEIFEECNDKRVCYYASSLDNKVIDQGCGDSSNIEPFAICSEKFCNTKELLDKSLFCLNDGSIKLLKQCHTECFVQRHSNGTLQQGCGFWTCKVDNEGDCYTCKEKYCNEEKHVNQHCLENDGKTCKVPFGHNCFEQRTETNEGCGDCTLKERCFTCNNHLCNNGKNVLYYCKSEHGEQICYKPDCYISLKEGNQKGYNYNCGNCTENIKQKCVDCNNRPLCNNKELIENSLFCWKKTENRAKISGNRICKSKCFVERNKYGQVIQNCGGICSESKEDCIYCNKTYCNEESLVPKHCWTNEGICKTKFNIPCFMERISKNKCCGECLPSSACKQCIENRCNNWTSIPYYCNSSHGTKECETENCYILKLNDKEDNLAEYYYNCGKCPISTKSDEILSKKLNGVNINEIQCVECNDGNLCNSDKYFESQLFCWEKTKLKTNKTKGMKICEKECFVLRDINGTVEQGCGNCLPDNRSECKTCKNKKYCNEENLVSIHCYDDKNENKTCKTSFNSFCYLLRNSTNGVSKGCGKCPFYTCKECNGHLCNDENKIKLPFYCFGLMTNYKECNETNCYIANIEINNKKQFYYDCGKCPSNNILLNLTKNNLIQNMSNVQCTECNNSPACNSDKLFESKLFCLEKNFNKWKINKGYRICEEGFCFIGFDNKEI
uniref:Galectin domain-containing protein n=1 Tax=Meloidogyne hapla TaxID=6305 RepID=A0A1I8BU93_MELHA